MPKNKGENELEEEANRLGDRFSGTSSEEMDEAEEPEPGSEEIEWVPTTVYVPEKERKTFRRFLKRVTLDYPEVEEAQKRELHTAVLRTAMDHPEQVAEEAEAVIGSD